MSSASPRHPLEIKYEKAAQAYLRTLPLEHFAEAIDQATQRKITLESLDILTLRRPDVHVFNELLVQYPLGRRQQIHQVVPDNVVVVWKEPIKAETNFAVPLQPTGPFWVLDYVSKGSKRKDYQRNFTKYERELTVPYYLAFYVDTHEIKLFHLTEGKYLRVESNEQGRCRIPELELEVGLLDGWVRYWYQGQLLLLAVELLRELDAAREQLVITQRLVATQHQLDKTLREIAQLRAQLAKEKRGRRKNGS